mgnify:CR=1 FL=1
MVEHGSLQRTLLVPFNWYRKFTVGALINQVLIQSIKNMCHYKVVSRTDNCSAIQACVWEPPFLPKTTSSQSQPELDMLWINNSSWLWHGDNMWCALHCLFRLRKGPRVPIVAFSTAITYTWHKHGINKTQGFKHYTEVEPLVSKQLGIPWWESYTDGTWIYATDQ